MTDINRGFQAEEHQAQFWHAFHKGKNQVIILTRHGCSCSPKPTATGISVSAIHAPFTSLVLLEHVKALQIQKSTKHLSSSQPANILLVIRQMKTQVPK